MQLQHALTAELPAPVSVANPGTCARLL